MPSCVLIEALVGDGFFFCVECTFEHACQHDASQVDAILGVLLQPSGAIRGNTFVSVGAGQAARAGARRPAGEALRRFTLAPELYRCPL